MVAQRRDDPVAEDASAVPEFVEGELARGRPPRDVIEEAHAILYGGGTPDAAAWEAARSQVAQLALGYEVTAAFVSGWAIGFAAGVVDVVTRARLSGGR